MRKLTLKPGDIHHIADQIYRITMPQPFYAPKSREGWGLEARPTGQEIRYTGRAIKIVLKTIAILKNGLLKKLVEGRQVLVEP